MLLATCLNSNEPIVSTVVVGNLLQLHYNSTMVFLRITIIYAWIKWDFILNSCWTYAFSLSQRQTTSVLLYEFDLMMRRNLEPFIGTNPKLEYKTRAKWLFFVAISIWLLFLKHSLEIAFAFHWSLHQLLPVYFGEFGWIWVWISMEMLFQAQTLNRFQIVYFAEYFRNFPFE